jgi:hypothetical protein
VPIELDRAGDGTLDEILHQLRLSAVARRSRRD